MFDVISDGLKSDTIKILSTGKKKGSKAKQAAQSDQLSGGQGSNEGASGESAGATVSAGGLEHGTTVKIVLNFKRYVFDPNKRMIQ